MQPAYRNYLCFLAVSAVLVSTSSCTTNQVASEMKVPPVQAHVLGAIESAASRTLASTEDANRYEAEFQKVLQSENPAAATSALIDRSVRLFYRTQALLQRYDARLDALVSDRSASPNAAMTDDTYAMLASAWALREENHGLIQYFGYSDFFVGGVASAV